MDTLEQKLWLALHLLYPNSAQAVEAYELILRQNHKVIKDDKAGLVLQRIVSIFEKIPALSSNLSFYEFDHEKVEIWRLAYREAHKSQLFVLIAIFVFNFKPNDVAAYLKITEEKVYFLIQQIFRKLLSSIATSKYVEPVQAKKQQDNKISYLYTSENLVGYSLDFLVDDDKEKVQAGLELYPILKNEYLEFLNIINRIKELKVLKVVPFANELGRRNTISNLQSSDHFRSINLDTNGSSQNRNANLYLVGFFGIVFAVFIAVQLFQKTNSSKVANFVEVVNIEKSTNPSSPKVDPVNSTKVNPANEAKQLEKNSNDKVNVTRAVSEKAKPVVVRKLTSSTEGGLYRGLLKLNSKLNSNLAISNKKIREVLVKLGAKKAGEVELGWMKTKNIAYYHYTISENAISDANKVMAQLGDLSLKFESHPRQISSGERRFIVEVQGSSGH